MLAIVGVLALQWHAGQERERAAAEAAAAQTAAQDAAWNAAVNLEDGSGLMTVSDAGESVHVANRPLQTCTATEIEAVEDGLWSKYLDEYDVDLLGLASQRASAEAPGKCASLKQEGFEKSVLDAQGVTTRFLKAIGAPESASAQLEGMRGLDGTRDIELDTKAGPVTMHAQYDGFNGLNVVFTREKQHTD